jgi:hypothetical protein
MMNNQYTSAARAYTPNIENNSLNNVLSNVGFTINDHADRIDKMFVELNDLKGFYQWITDTYPEHMQQYRAVLDLKKASE